MMGVAVFTGKGHASRQKRGATQQKAVLLGLSKPTNQLFGETEPS
jgi:hypothetical protein